MASAKKRVEHALAKQQQRGGGSGTIQINTTVDDPQKSIDELINAGLRTHQERGPSKHFNKNIKYPPSFWRPQPKPRYASGHSRDSSDDGFGSLAGRHTLSPSSVSSFGPHGHAGTLPGPLLTSASQSDILHKRQASAPALINYEQFEGQHQQQQAPAFGGGQPGFSGAAAANNSGSGGQQIHQQQMQQQQQFHQQGPTNCNNNNNDAARGAAGGSLKNRSSAGLPPLGHQPYHHAYSRSLNAVTASPPAATAAAAGAHHSVHSVGHQSQSSVTPTTNPMFLSAIGAELPPAGNHHRGAKSCDYDMMGGASGHPGASAGGQMATQPMGNAPGQFGQQPAAFYGQQIQQAAFDNLIWPNQRAKSQSMDPLSFQQQSSTSRGGGFRPDIDFPYPDLSSSHSIGSPPTDPSPQQMLSSPTALPFLNAQQHQSTSPQSAEPMILCVKEEDDPLGPMPDGWQKAVAPNGDPYFIDHTNKETTWYDPRIPKAMQEAQIMLRHTNQQQQMGGNGTRGPQHGYSQSVGGVANTRMGPIHGNGSGNAFAVDSNFNQQGVSTAPNGPANPMAIGGLDRVQQLMQEKHQIQEKRDQIIRQGFLDSNYRQNQQQPQFGGGGHSSQQQIGGGNAPAGQFPQHATATVAAFLQPQRGTPTAAGGGVQSDLMEVDSASPFQHQSVTGYIDPIFKDYNFNPHEFEQYLNINENPASRSAAAAAVATTQPQQNMAQ